jgi:hypothetical protein
MWTSLQVKNYHSLLGERHTFMGCTCRNYLPGSQVKTGGNSPPPLEGGNAAILKYTACWPSLPGFLYKEAGCPESS